MSGHPTYFFRGPCGPFLNDKTIFASLPQGPLSLMEMYLNTVCGSAACFQGAWSCAAAALKELTMHGRG